MNSIANFLWSILFPLPNIHFFLYMLVLYANYNASEFNGDFRIDEDVLAIT